MSSNYWDLQQLATQVADLAAAQAAQIQDLQRQLNDLVAMATDGSAAAGAAAVDTNALQRQIEDLRAVVATAGQPTIAPALDTIAGLPDMLPFGTGIGVDWRPFTLSRLTSFPYAPTAGQLCFRTDLNLLCKFYSSYWGAALPHWCTPDELADVVACWHFGHRNGATVFDSTKRARDLTANGTPGYALFPQRGAYATLNGTSQYFSNANTDFGNFAAGSTCLWVYANSFASSPVFIGNDVNPGTRGWMMYADNSGELNISVAGASDASERYSLDVSHWYLLWFVYNGTTAYGYAYDDPGEKPVANLTAAIGAQASAFKIGMMNGTYFNGRVAAPKFFGAAVSQSLREYVFLCERPLIG